MDRYVLELSNLAIVYSVHHGLAPSQPGKWFGTRGTVTKAGTDSLYNVKKWGNPIDKVRTYRLTKEATVYYGKVAGGKGYQVLFPKNIDPGSVLEFVAEVALR